MSQSERVVLSAEWRNLVMLNYELEPGLLRRYVPPGTSLDSFQGRTYVSLVGFQFSRTKLLGRFPIPFHSDFDEVNLRFCVRRKAGSEERRGVVFIAEVVPKAAIANTARVLYGENYVCLPMRQDCNQWVGEYRRVSKPAPEGSLEQFITEHYWGLFDSTIRRVAGISRLA